MFSKVISEEGGEADGCTETVKVSQEWIYCDVCIVYDPGCLPDHLAGLFDGSFLYGSRDYAYCIWTH